MVQTVVFDSELVGYRGVRRVIAVRDDLTLVDLHYALQSAFGWDDDHLYAFWMGGGFWAGADTHYASPCSDLGQGTRSAAIGLQRLGLAEGRRMTYVFDFGDEWRVRLRVSDVLADDPGPSPRLLAWEGAAPPQYPVHAGAA